jgi:hypothetical protein
VHRTDKFTLAHTYTYWGPNEGGEKRDSKRKLKQRERVGMDEMNGRKKENQSLEQNI